MPQLTDKKIKKLEKMALTIRRDIIELLIEAKEGHTAGPLGMADIFTALYFHVLKHTPEDPMWPERDRLILSNGHIAPVRYAAMARAGYFPLEELKTFRKINSRLEGHPNMRRLPALETTSGPLGEGLSQACGFALAAKLDGKDKDYHIWCLTSDGELQEGMSWEAAMLASKYRLNNLTAVVDRNNIQIDGVTEDVMPLEPLREKFQSFGWHVEDINAHDMRAVITALEESKAIQEKPVCIIANTTPGKGVSFIENRHQWHGVPPGSGPEDVLPKDKQGQAALAEIDKALALLE